MSEKKTPPYSARFEAFAKTVPLLNDNVRKAANASLTYIAEVFDEDIQEKIKKNPDLLYISSNLILLDEANLNDDCVSLEDILPVYKKFKDKFIDIEHDRKYVVGSICEAGFSLFPSNMILEEEDIEKYKEEKIQLVIGGFLWRIVNSSLCEVVESASLESSPTFGDVNTSYELLFDYYDIGVGINGNRSLKEAIIIKSDDSKFVEYDSLLRANGGNGLVSKGSKDIVFRILKNIFPAGAGIVAKPASGLKGILALDLENAPKETEEEEEEDEKEETEVEEETESKDMDGEKTREDEETHASQDLIEEKNINLEKNSVNADIQQNKDKIMHVQIKDLNDITSKWSDIIKNEANANEIRKFIADEIVKESEKFAEKLAEKENLLKTVEANKKSLEDKAKTLEDTVTQLSKQLQEIKASQDQALAESKFNERMAALDEVFDLDGEDDVRAILTEEVKAIESDESFAAWMDKKKKLMKEKTKAAKCEKKTQMASELAKAGIKVDLEKDKDLDFAKIFAAAKENPGQDVPNGVHVTENLKDKFAKAFGEGITINSKNAQDVINK